VNTANMTPSPSGDPTGPRLRFGTSASAVVLVASLFCTSLWGAQGASAPAQMPIKPAPEQGVRWADMKPAQQSTLKPLERDWAAISSPQKQKWLELSTRFPTMTPAEQGRVQERMSEWARMTPQQRGQARLNFQEAKQLPTEDRQARWDAYQALSPEQKQRLAARAVPAASGPAPGALRTQPQTTARVEKPGREMPQAKSNIVPNPALAAQRTAIAPTVVQAGPGATTTPVTKRPSPPSHQQSGMPKIAATPEFVNKSTLLPQSGPQSTATKPAVAPAAETPARK
jgi:hypothetical protein